MRLYKIFQQENKIFHKAQVILFALSPGETNLESSNSSNVHMKNVDLTNSNRPLSVSVLLSTYNILLYKSNELLSLKFFDRQLYH